MGPFVLSMLVVVGGFVVVWRSARRAHRIAGVLLASLGFATSMWAHPTPARLARANAVDREMCRAVADQFERWGRSPPISRSGHVAQLMHRSKPERPVTEVTDREDDDHVKLEEEMMLHALSRALVDVCVAGKRREFEWSPAFGPLGTRLADDARRRDADELAAILRTGTLSPVALPR